MWSWDIGNLYILFFYFLYENQILEIMSIRIWAEITLFQLRRLIVNSAISF